MHYMNPFDFVPLPPNGPRPMPKKLKSGPLLEGYITYTIKTLTPLHITGRTTRSGNHFQTKFFNENYGKRVIPGASIRGMLSAFIEALTGSDLRSFTRGNEKIGSGAPYSKKYGRHVGFLLTSPDHALADKTKVETYTHRGRTKTGSLHERHNTLPKGFGKNETDDAARFLFGYVDEEKDKAGENGSANAGRLIFEDVVLPDSITMMTAKAWDLNSDAIMGGPNPRANTAWYFTPGENRVRMTAEGHRVWEVLADQVRGRKFYFHQHPEGCHAEYGKWKRWMPAMTEYQVEAVPPGVTIGKGRIDFNQLPESLLTLLAYAVNLEPGMAHKLGGLKPYGFGSVEMSIDIDGLEYRDMANPLDAIEPRGLKGRLKTELLDSTAYRRMKRIFHYPNAQEKDHYLFVYPPFHSKGRDPEQRGFATVEKALGREPSPGDSQKVTLFFDHYQKNAVNYKQVMEM